MIQIQLSGIRRNFSIFKNEKLIHIKPFPWQWSVSIDNVKNIFGPAIIIQTYIICSPEDKTIWRKYKWIRGQNLEKIRNYTQEKSSVVCVCVYIKRERYQILTVIWISQGISWSKIWKISYVLTVCKWTKLHPLEHFHQTVSRIIEELVRKQHFKDFPPPSSCWMTTQVDC